MRWIEDPGAAKQLVFQCHGEEEVETYRQLLAYIHSLGSASTLPAGQRWLEFAHSLHARGLEVARAKACSLVRHSPTCTQQSFACPVCCWPHPCALPGILLQSPRRSSGCCCWRVSTPWIRQLRLACRRC